MQKYMERERDGLPESMRSELVKARRDRRWSQAELGQRVGLPQEHISVIETGKVVPRFDTLLEIVRVLDRDLVMVPRTLLPAVRAMIRDQAGAAEGEGERPLYAFDAGEERDET